MPSFNPLEHPASLHEPLRLTQSSWADNVPFGMLMVDLLRPRLLVELGTKRGVSYCSLCQAVAELGLATRCWAVDLWPDETEGGSYLDFYNELRAYHDPMYGGFSELLRMSFDDALPRFEDSSVDLLHIDGLHSYDAVRHDFETWLPKMSARGVVLLHDTVVPPSEGFGVREFFEELAERYPVFNLTHGMGLGVVGVGESSSSALPFFTIAEDQKAHVQTLYRQLGERLVLRQERLAAERELKRAAKHWVELERIKRSRSYRALEPVRRATSSLRRLVGMGA